MGRYYDGDIDGKFWFAVQSSDDADFFGVEGTAAYLHYYFDKEEDYDGVVKGLELCVKALGEDKFKRLHEAFSEGGKLWEGYNDEKLKEVIPDIILETERPNSPDYFGTDLEWYARWRLGDKIKTRLDHHDECQFNAEL